MNPLLIAGGIYLTARVIGFVFDELTDQELTAEKRNRDAVDAYDRRIAALRMVKEQHEADYQQQLTQEVRNRNDFLLTQAHSRLEDERTLYREIENSLREVNGALKGMDETTTALRRSGLERLLNQLYGAKERCFGYQEYLKQYVRFVESAIGQEDIEPFSMRIPPKYPYVGKICRIPAGALAKGRILKDDTLQGIRISYMLDCGESLERYADDCVLPFMVEKYDSGRCVHPLSLAKGTFYTEALENTRVGVQAVVREIQKSGILLTYQDSLYLFLRKEHLLKPYRTPPVRSEMTVYPVRWFYGLTAHSKEGYSVLVSEKTEDVTAGFRFPRFPMIFNATQWAELNQYMQENRITYEDEWKVGPLEEQNLAFREGFPLKFQFGDALILQADLYALRSGVEDDADQYILAFQKILTPDNGFHADDIFIDIDVNMTPVTVEHFESVEQFIDLREAQLFLMDIFTEFLTQKKIKESMSGAHYFCQWSIINQKLIDYLRKGQEFVVQVSNVQCIGNNLILEIGNNEQLRTQLEGYIKEQDARRNGNPSQINLFVEDNAGTPCGIFIKPDFQTATVYNCRQSSLPLNSDGHLCIYAEAIPYPEIQQSIALSQLRIGRLVNPALQAAMMAGENISSDRKSLEMLVLKNQAITKNHPQYDALIRALEEKNIFFIQGPPGTGKTTVIREMVEQQLRREPSSRILIVSQANVAVDNALSGIVRSHKEVTVRCGNASKIGNALRETTLENHYGRYIQRVQSLHGKVDKEIFSRWMEFVAPENGINPNIGELIIKSCKIIGATCIGLAKKRIGLERVEFDLVIADEAGKALPGEILIPVLRAKKLVMIGDHRQLPPVINPALYDPEKIELDDRDVIESCLFSVSLFQRLFETAPESNKAMLRTQYRMPAIVGTMVSHLFYNGQLENGTGTENRSPLYSGSNLTFYDFSRDAQYREEKREEFGIINSREADFIVHLLIDITEKAPGHSIAVITPYRGQMRLIQNKVLQVGRRLRNEAIRINTIDAFQGDEAEIVIYCTTRGQRQTLFFADKKRINVALSRATNELIIVGRVKYFTSYRDDSSPLPAIAKYVQNYGKIIPISASEQWDTTHWEGTSVEQIVPTSKIFCYHDLEGNNILSVEAAIRYYYEHGHMECPVVVHLEGEKYIVDGNVDIFVALQKLELSECWVNVTI